MLASECRMSPGREGPCSGRISQPTSSPMARMSSFRLILAPQPPLLVPVAQAIVEEDAAHRGVEKYVLGVHAGGHHHVLVVVLLAQDDQLARVPDADGRVGLHPARLVGLLHLGEGGEDASRAPCPVPLLREVVDGSEVGLG